MGALGSHGPAETMDLKASPRVIQMPPANFPPRPEDPPIDYPATSGGAFPIDDPTIPPEPAYLPPARPMGGPAGAPHLPSANPPANDSDYATISREEYMQKQKDVSDWVNKTETPDVEIERPTSLGMPGPQGLDNPTKPDWYKHVSGLNVNDPNAHSIPRASTPESGSMKAMSPKESKKAAKESKKAAKQANKAAKQANKATKQANKAGKTSKAATKQATKEQKAAAKMQKDDAKREAKKAKMIKTLDAKEMQLRKKQADVEAQLDKIKSQKDATMSSSQGSEKSANTQKARAKQAKLMKALNAKEAQLTKKQAEIEAQLGQVQEAKANPMGPVKKPKETKKKSKPSKKK